MSFFYQWLIGESERNVDTIIPFISLLITSASSLNPTLSKRTDACWFAFPIPPDGKYRQYVQKYFVGGVLFEYIKTASSSNSNGSSHAVTKRKTMTRGKRRGELHSIGIAVRRASARSATRLARNGSSVRRTLANTLVNKYANRRTSLFKSNRPLKAPRRKATIRTHDSLWDTEGRLFRLGDIVSVLDEDDGLPYFGQIRGIITDTHGGQYAVLNWLIPMDTAFDAHQFDAEHFAHAIADETFYPFEVCSFVQTAPELPAYQREWTPRACAEEQLRREMSERLANLKAIASEKLRFMDASITADGSQSTRVMIA